MLAARRRPPLVLFCVSFLLGPSALSFQVIGVFWDGGWACGWAVVGACACAALFSLWVKFRKRMNWTLPDEEANTLAGIIMQHAKRLPEQGENFHIQNLKLTILERKRNQLLSILVDVLD